MKKILISSFIASFAISSLLASEANNNVNNQILGGDTGLACEAILCLSSPARPSECMRSLTKYFSIHFKKPWKTANARKEFLNLCPAGSMSPEMKQQVEDLSRLTGYCTENELNANIEMQKTGRLNMISRFYRVSPEMTENCKILTRLNYNDYSFKYTCDKSWYSQKEWNMGKKLLGTITKDEYDKLNDTQRYFEIIKKEVVSPDKSHTIEIPYYYKAEPINKACWVDEKKH